mmetsp:Transcript_16720/g.27198  ORF Transcript_16720/g.27198 Transcript_16720/m.27198 type:complete len:232 (-) Transcript_16720:122-817(-)
MFFPPPPSFLFAVHLLSNLPPLFERVYISPNPFPKGQPATSTAGDHNFLLDRNEVERRGHLGRLFLPEPELQPKDRDLIKIELQSSPLINPCESSKKFKKSKVSKKYSICNAHSLRIKALYRLHREVVYSSKVLFSLLIPCSEHKLPAAAYSFQVATGRSAAAAAAAAAAPPPLLTLQENNGVQQQVRGHVPCLAGLREEGVGPLRGEHGVEGALFSLPHHFVQSCPGLLG